MLPLMRLNRNSRKRLTFSLAALFGSAALGMLGYSVVEGWSLADSLYMTVMTVTTVGYGPPLPLSAAGRNFTILFMIVGVSATAYALSSAVQTLVHSEIVTTLVEIRRHREMSKLNNHFIICGAGRIGARIIYELERAGATFVVIETDADRVADLAERNVPVLNRDATLDETLHEAGVERACGLAACLSDDADNVYVVLSARALNKNLYIVARAIEEQAEQKLKKAGANRVVAPIIIGSHRMAQALVKPALADFMDSVTVENLDLGFEQVEVTADSVYVGQELRSTNIRSELDIVIVAIKRPQGEMIFNPPDEARVETGDLLIAIGRPDPLARLAQLARGQNSK